MTEASRANESKALQTSEQTSQTTAKQSNQASDLVTKQAFKLTVSLRVWGTPFKKRVELKSREHAHERATQVKPSKQNRASRLGKQTEAN